MIDLRKEEKESGDVMATGENDSEIVKEPESNCFRGVEKRRFLKEER